MFRKAFVFKLRRRLKSLLLQLRHQGGARDVAEPLAGPQPEREGLFQDHERALDPEHRQREREGRGRVSMSHRLFTLADQELAGHVDSCR